MPGLPVREDQELGVRRGLRPCGPAVEQESGAPGIPFWHPKRLIDHSPPWMVSLVFHMALLLILGVLAFNPKVREILGVVMDPSAKESESAAAFSIAGEFSRRARGKDLADL